MRKPCDRVIPNNKLTTRRTRKKRLVTGRIKQASARLLRQLSSRPGVPTTSAFLSQTFTRTAITGTLTSGGRHVRGFLGDDGKGAVVARRFPRPVKIDILGKRADSLPTSEILLVLVGRPHLPRKCFLLAKFPRV